MSLHCCDGLFPLSVEGGSAWVFQRRVKRCAPLLFFGAMTFGAVGVDKRDDFFLKSFFGLGLRGFEFRVTGGSCSKGCVASE